ncbi:DUF6884 domain-containing protein [Streptomyces sp. NPDC055078]
MTYRFGELRLQDSANPRASPCGGRKADVGTRRVPAAELYVGSYHKALRRAADALVADGGSVFILSALHGIVPPARLLSPYDVRLTDARAVKPEVLVIQVHDLGLTDADVLFLGARAYADLIQAVLPGVLSLLEGTAGIGEQLHRLKRLALPGAVAVRASHWAEACRRGERLDHLR